MPLGQLKIGRIARDRKPHLTNAVIGDPEVSDQEWARRERMVAFAGLGDLETVIEKENGFGLGIDYPGSPL